MLARWWRRRRAARALAIADADNLIARFGADARSESRQRVIDARRGVVLDPDRPARHWERVHAIIGRRQPSNRTDTATRYLSN